MDIQIEKHNSVNFRDATLPIIASVFSVYLTIGISLGLLPIFVQQSLGFNSLIVGVVIGLQFLSTLSSRAYAGRITDTKGAKHANKIGVILALVAGAFYILATSFLSSPLMALGFLMLARVFHGAGESLLVTGALAWGIGLVGQEKSGKVMTWNGIAMYGGIAIGAPLSIWMNGGYGFFAAFILMLVLPALGWLATTKLPGLSVDPNFQRTPFYKVIGTISGQGLSLAFSSMAFGCIASFIALYFREMKFGDPSLAFMVFGVAYVLTRVFFASLPDKFGGYKVAFASFIIEVIGQLMIWNATSPTMAIIGCGLTAVGFSLVFPALGVIAIQKVSPQMRGTALGAYAAFVDLSLGLAGPMAGLIAGWFSYQAVYLFGALSCVLALVILLFNKE